MKRLHVLCASTGSPQSLGAQARGTHPQLASAIRTIGGGSVLAGLFLTGAEGGCDSGKWPRC